MQHYVDKVKEHIDYLVDSYPERYFFNDVLNDQDLIQDAVDYVAEGEEVDSDELYEASYERLYPKTIQYIERDLIEQANERRSYERDPYAYNGLRRSDFL